MPNETREIAGKPRIINPVTGLIELVEKEKPPAPLTIIPVAESTILPEEVKPDVPEAAFDLFYQSTLLHQENVRLIKDLTMQAVSHLESLPSKGKPSSHHIVSESGNVFARFKFITKGGKLVDRDGFILAEEKDHPVTQSILRDGLVDSKLYSQIRFIDLTTTDKYQSLTNDPPTVLFQTISEELAQIQAKYQTASPETLPDLYRKCIINIAALSRVRAVNLDTFFQTFLETQKPVLWASSGKFLIAEEKKNPPPPIVKKSIISLTKVNLTRREWSFLKSLNWPLDEETYNDLVNKYGS